MLFAAAQTVMFILLAIYLGVSYLVAQVSSSAVDDFKGSLCIISISTPYGKSPDLYLRKFPLFGDFSMRLSSDGHMQ